MGSSKKFLGNKNVVTLLGMIVIVVVLYLFYQWRVDSAVQFRKVMMATKNIDRMVEIDRSMYTTEEIPEKALIGNVIYDEGQLAGRFSGVNSYIPIGSFFYYSSANSVGNIVNKYDLPIAFLFEFDLDKDVIAYNYLVNNTTSYSNSLIPGNYMDIYLRIAKTSDTKETKYTFGKLVENVKILAVKDGSGRNVFNSTNERRSPSMVIFGVDTETNKYLRTAEVLDGAVEIIVVPTNVNLIDEGTEYEAQMTTQELKDYLDDFLDFKEDEETVLETETETVTQQTETTTEASSGTVTETNEQVPQLPKIGNGTGE